MCAIKAHLAGTGPQFVYVVTNPAVHWSPIRIPAIDEAQALFRAADEFDVDDICMEDVVAECMDCVHNGKTWTPLQIAVQCVGKVYYHDTVICSNPLDLIWACEALLPRPHTWQENE